MRVREIYHRRERRRGFRRDGGFMVAETTIGIILITTLLLITTTAVVGHERSLRQLAAVRKVERDVETALLRLQAGEAVADETIQVRRLTGAPPAAGLVWVEVSSESGGHSARLVGLAPAAAAPEEAKHATP